MTRAERLAKFEILAHEVEKLNDVRISLFSDLIPGLTDDDARVREVTARALAELNGVVSVISD